MDTNQSLIRIYEYLRLGYSHSEAREALKNIPKELTSTSARVKHALKLLGK